MMARGVVRGLTLLWALLQFALPTAATYADAMLERASGDELVLHIEADGTAGCPTVHPSDCALCHIAHRLARPSADAKELVLAERAVLPTHVVAVSLASADRGRLPFSRAPPSV